MAKRFEKRLEGEVATLLSNPFEQFISPSSSGLKFDNVILPADEYLISKGGQQAIHVYKRLFLDSTVQTAFNKLIQEIISREIVVIPYSDKAGDKFIAEDVKSMLTSLPFDTITKKFLEALVTGIQVGEIMWTRSEGGRVYPTEIRLRDLRRFRMIVDEKSPDSCRLRLLTKDNFTEGIDVPARKFITYKYDIVSNENGYGYGIGSILYPLVKFKRRAKESAVIYSDRYATPLAIATAPLTAHETEIDTLYDALSNLSQENAIILPMGFTLDFLNAEGKAEIFSALEEGLAKEINLLISGEHEVGNEDAGSRASSEVANGLRVTRAKELSELFCDIIKNSLIRWYVDYNFGPNVELPKIKRNFPEETGVEVTLADVDIIQNKLGLPVSRQWLEDKFDVVIDEEKLKEREKLQQQQNLQNQQRVVYDPNQAPMF